MKNYSKKGIAPPRYDEDFKAGAIRLVIEEKRTPREVATELGICVDTLKTWLKKSGNNSITPTIKEQNRLKELEAEIKILKKSLAEERETVEILKKATGIFLKT